MKKITKILASALTAFALTASFGVLSACSLFDSSESNNSDNSSSNNTPTTVPIEAVELDKTALTLEVGDDPVQLTASILPEDATETVTWESEDTSIATVDATGKVTAVAQGVTSIFANTEDENVYAVCTVTVYAPLGEALVTIETSDSRNDNGGTGTIAFYENGQYTVNYSYMAENDISIRALYSVNGGVLTLEESSFTFMGFLEFTTYNTVKLKESGALLVIGRSFPGDPDKDTIFATLTAENLTTLGVAPLASDKINHIAGITLTESAYMLTSGTSMDFADVVTLTAEDPDSELTEDEYQINVLQDSSVLNVSGTTVLGLKAGTAIVTVTPKACAHTLTAAAMCTVTVSYPEVEGYDLTNDPHFAETVSFHAESVLDLGDLGQIPVVRDYIFYADGTVDVYLLGSIDCVALYKLDDATNPTKVSIYAFNGEMNNDVALSKNNDGLWTFTITSADNTVTYDFIEKATATVVCTATDATTNVTITFMSDGTFTTTALDENNAAQAGKWAVENGELKIWADPVDMEAMIGMVFTPVGSVTVNQDGSASVAFKITTSGSALSGLSLDSVYTTNAVLSAEDLAKLLG